MAFIKPPQFGRRAVRRLNGLLSCRFTSASPAWTARTCAPQTAFTARRL